MEKKEMSLILNMLLIIFECIGFIIAMYSGRGIEFEYYTEDSNLLAMIASIVLVLYLSSNKEIPKWLSLFKYITNIGLTITFIVVLFILIPMYNFDFGFLFLEGPLLYQHLICPILCITSFILFDDIGELTFKDTLVGMSFTVIYGAILIPLNAFEVVTGPYPFLMVNDQHIIVSIAWSVLLFVLGFIIADTLRKVYNIAHK